MAKRLTAIALLIALLLPVLTALASDPGNLGDPASRTVLKAKFDLVAVIENKEKSVLIPAELSISYPGNGTIYVGAGGGIGRVTLESTYQAVKLAALLAGVDWRFYDFNITFQTNSGIDGPSGSMMISLVTYTLLSGAPSLAGYNGIVVTGAISPDGLASSVGAIEYKCSAASERGMQFYYPLINYTETLERECKGETYTSLVNLVSLIYNVTEPPIADTPFMLPGSFNRTMRHATNAMINESLKLAMNASRLGVTYNTLKRVYDYINKSMNVLDSHPYAAASLAFTALNKAYNIYYMALTQNNTYEEAKERLDAVAESVDRELSMLESKLDSMPRNGSLYYAEFVSTAYTRLAAAKSSILAYHNYSDTPDLFFTSAIPELAHASARITSIEEWIRSANATRSVAPWISEDDLERLAWILRDYATTSGRYASALAEYAVKYYGRSRSILVYIDILSRLEETGARYLDEGNYMAAIGFFRELLSQSLNVMFQSSIQAYKGPSWVLDEYYRELTRIYSIVTGRLLMRGLAPGLAPAYLDYSRVMLSYNYTDPAIQLLDEAVVSALSWDMLSLAMASSNRTSSAVGVGGTSSLSVIESIIIITVVGLGAYMLGYLSSIKSVARILQET